MPQTPYVYDPSQKIKKTFEQTAQGIDDAWKPIIESKIQGFNAIKEARENQEKIKANLNRFNREEITKRSNELQRETANLIRSKGRIDKEGLATIQEKMEALKNAELQSRDAPAIINEYLSMAQANATYINDLPGLANKIMKAGYDKELLFKSTSLSEHLGKEYYKSLNIPFLITERVKRQTKEAGQDTPINYRDSQGNMVVGSYKKLPGTFFNEATGRVELEKGFDPNKPNSTIIDRLSTELLSPEEMRAYIENNMGAAVAFAVSPEDEIKNRASEAYLAGADVKITKVTSAEDLAEKIETAKYKKNQNESFSAEESRKERTVAAREQSAQASIMGASASVKNANTSAERLQAEKDGIIKTGRSTSESKPPRFIPDKDGFLNIEAKIGDEEIGAISVTKNGIKVRDKYGSERYIKDTREANKLRSSLSGEERDAYDNALSSARKEKTGGANASGPVDVTNLFK